MFFSLLHYVQPHYQGRTQIHNGGGGGDIHIFVLTDLKNNRFQK